MARRLMTFLNNIHILNANNLVAFVTSKTFLLKAKPSTSGTKGTGADSMSPEDQRKVLQQFNDGEVKVFYSSDYLKISLDNCSNLGSRRRY